KGDEIANKGNNRLVEKEQQGSKIEKKKKTNITH
ncbi:M23 family peptidase, partial [Staphylococcus shinii]